MAIKNKHKYKELNPKIYWEHPIKNALVEHRHDGWHIKKRYFRLVYHEGGWLPFITGHFYLKTENGQIIEE